MKHNYTVLLQSKQTGWNIPKPYKFKTSAHSITEIFDRLRRMNMFEFYKVKSIIRRPNV